MTSQATWKAGAQVEVGWTVSAHHGGGYAYRLAKADEPLTEENFRKLPLDFVGNSILRWGGDRGSQIEFNTTERGWETRVGTVPPGRHGENSPSRQRYGSAKARPSSPCARRARPASRRCHGVGGTPGCASVLATQMAARCCPTWRWWTSFRFPPPSPLASTWCSGAGTARKRTRSGRRARTSLW